METVTFRVRSLVWFATGVVVTLLATLVVLQSWQVDAAPGDLDSTFVPITACRLIDTRPPPDRVGPHATLGVADTTTMQATGSNGKCVIPADAVGLSMNVTALNATIESFLTFWPSGTLPLAASLNPFPGQPPIPNAVTVSLSATGAFNVYNNLGTVDIVIDVNGYHTKTSLSDLAARVNANETGIATNTGNIATNTGNIATLDAREPFAVTNTVADITLAGLSPAEYVRVPVTAPVAGQVTVDSTAWVGHNSNGGQVYCAIFETGSIPATFIEADTPGFQKWATGGLSGEGSLSGTRTFDIAAGATVSYSLVCEEASDGGLIATRNLTAIFTPAP